MMARTELLYQTDMSLFDTTANCIAFRMIDEVNAIIILDRTLFHPQGGGQPSDTGHITSQSTGVQFTIDKVLYNANTMQVEHHTIIKPGHQIYLEGEHVTMQVDQVARKYHSRLHTAGHMIHHAIESLNYPLKKTKSYHFPDSPCIECMVTEDSLNVNPEGLSEIKESIERLCQRWISENKSIIISTSKLTELESDHNLSEKAQSAEMIRFVSFDGVPNPRPCGGTHVSSTSQLTGFVIKKVTCKKGILKISYQCAK